jgi:uncharacterized protein YkwD
MNGGRTLLASLTVLLVALFAGVYGLLELHGVAGRATRPASRPVVRLSELARGGEATSAGAPTGPAAGPGPGLGAAPGTGLGTAPGTAPGPGAAGGVSGGLAAAQVLAVINQARTQAGLPGYTVSAGLEVSSGEHTAVMAGGCGLSHRCPGEAIFSERISRAGVSWTSCGENIGDRGPAPDNAAAIAQVAVQLTWQMLNERPPDDGHRRNILSPSFRHIGIRVFRDARGWVWMTQDFSG